MRFDNIPLHPLTVHFPIALLSTSVLWDSIGLWQGSSLWWAMSFWTLAVGLVSSIPAFITGFAEFAALPVESPSESTVNWHLALMGGAVAFFLVSLLIRGAPARLEGPRLLGALSSSMVGLGFLAAGGHLGARLIYAFGVGTESPASPDR